jgi:hypothetical protein
MQARIARYWRTDPWLVAEEGGGRIKSYAYACLNRERAAHRWAALRIGCACNFRYAKVITLTIALSCAYLKGLDGRRPTDHPWSPQIGPGSAGVDLKQEALLFPWSSAGSMECAPGRRLSFHRRPGRFHVRGPMA